MELRTKSFLVVISCSVRQRWYSVASTMKDLAMSQHKPMKNCCVRRLDYRDKLYKLAEACSDHVLDGERGWEQMNFDEFVALCRKQCAKANSNVQSEKAEI